MEKKTPMQLALELLTKRKKPVKFTEIVEYIKTKLEISDRKLNSIIEDFYTEFSLDPTFVCVGKDSWTLRERVKFDSIKKAQYSEEDLEVLEDEDEDSQEEEISNETGDNGESSTNSSDSDDEEL